MRRKLLAWATKCPHTYGKVTPVTNELQVSISFHRFSRIKSKGVASIALTVCIIIFLAWLGLTLCQIKRVYGRT